MFYIFTLSENLMFAQISVYNVIIYYTHKKHRNTDARMRTYYVCMCVSVFLCISLCVCVHTYMYVCVNVCLGTGMCIEVVYVGACVYLCEW